MPVVARRAPHKQPDHISAMLPQVPTTEFARLKEASPAKKAEKGRDYIAHRRHQRATCEVMNIELQDPMMKPIYALNLPKLRGGQVTTWSSNEGSGMFMLSKYSHLNPKLSIPTVWALLLFVQKGYNLAWIDPHLLEARSPIYTQDSPRKRWVLSVDTKPAVCVSIVNTVQSSVRQISSVYGSLNAATPLLKFITGVHPSQDFYRITGLCGMLNMSALTFGTRGITLDKYVKEQLSSPEQKGIRAPRACTGNKPTLPQLTPLIMTMIFLFMTVDTPVYASVDIDDLAQILPLYNGEIPTNSCTAVAYTISNFVKSGPGREDEQHLSFNLKWVVVLGEPE
ncbi:hypothetical protein B0H14DRAFT_2619205 [Mycena olivaceomarginata]|nr:hypothetical protein B0H14DRAFT_2619205 [Mycena olivaceomarginata]